MYSRVVKRWLTLLASSLLVAPAVAIPAATASEQSHNTSTKSPTLVDVPADTGRHSEVIADSLASMPTSTAYVEVPKVPTSMSHDAVDKSRMHVKFVQSHPVRMRDGQLVTSARATWALEPIQQLLASDAVAKVEPLYPEKEEELKEMAVTAQQNTGQGQADLNQWYLITFADGKGSDELLNQVRQAAVVETAFFAPSPVKPPIGDLTSKQVYLGPASGHGIDALYAHQIPGGTGKNVTVADVEFGWTTNHEDLSKLRGAVVTRGTPRESYANHGTAVMGQIVADNNGRGVTGIAYDAKAILSHATTNRGYDPGSAIVTAAANLKAGDVLVLEQQVTGCGGGFAPVESVPSAYDAIKAAVGKGIHVVEAAGNGAQNLDQSCYGGRNYPGGKGDSGAIIVGAGASSICGRPGGTPLRYSTYGSRVDLHGWGECVYTTGYGDLQGGPATQHYTKKFSGTSSATPIVAGAVAVISSIAKERGINITPAQMRKLLVDTGTPQKQGRNIGPMPNLRKAIDSLPAGNNPADPVRPDPVQPDPVRPEPTDPQPTPGCDGYQNTVNGSLTAGGIDLIPNKKWYETAKNGTHTACLAGPAQGVDFDLYLQRWDGNAWQFVASATEAAAQEKLSYTGQSGFYRLVAFSPFTGQGAYKVGYNQP